MIYIKHGGINIATLEELLAIDGVIAAGEFTPEGKLIDFKAKGDMSQEIAEMTAQFCATVSMMFGTLATSYTKMSGMQWVPPKGWMYAGGEWTAAISGNKGVFIETKKADFNELYRILIGES